MGIPERLVEIREKYGYTRKRLAEELKRPYATVTKYETGEREPGHTFIVEVAKKFGVTTDYILGASDSPVSTVSLSLSQEEAGHIKKYRFLDPYGKEAVDGVLDVESRRCEAERQEQNDKDTPDPNDSLNDEEKDFMSYVKQLNHGQQEMILGHLQQLTAQRRILSTASTQAEVGENTLKSDFLK